MALTPKQRRFVDAVLGGASNRDAAIAAGYSEKTASAAGSRLVKHPEVKKALVKALGSMAEGESKPRRGADAADPEQESAESTGRSASELMRLHRDPRDFLLAVMNDLDEDTRLRVDAGKALLPFFHARKGDGGKKDAAKEAAQKAAGGRFAPKGPPRLVVNNDK